MARILPVRGGEAIVDDADYEWLAALGGWRLTSQGYVRRRETITDPKTGKRRRRSYSMHRLLMDPDDEHLHLDVDHRNRVKHDNRRENLRLVPRQINLLNSGMRRNNSTGAKRVYWSEREQQFYIAFRLNGESHGWRYYDTFDEAVAAQNSLSRHLHGEEAQFFPSSDGEIHFDDTALEPGAGILPFIEANRAKTHCPQGHPYEGDNLTTLTGGGRGCRTCQRETQRRNLKLRREENDACRARGEEPPNRTLPRTHCAHGHEWIDENISIDPAGRANCRVCRREAKQQRREGKRQQQVQAGTYIALNGEKTHCPQGHPFENQSTGNQIASYPVCRPLLQPD